jgi:hypothetical protein
LKETKFARTNAISTGRRWTSNLSQTNDSDFQFGVSEDSAQFEVGVRVWQPL